MAIATKAEDTPTPTVGAAGNAARDVLAERQRQISAEGWTPEHDDTHDKGELAWIAVSYAAPDLVYRKVKFANQISFQDPWPFTHSRAERGGPQGWDKRPYAGNMVLPNSGLDISQRRKQLVQSAALLIAEIERMDRTIGAIA